LFKNADIFIKTKPNFLDGLEQLVLAVKKAGFYCTQSEQQYTQP
jgi:hypothetical protein